MVSLATQMSAAITAMRTIITMKETSPRAGGMKPVGSHVSDIAESA